MNREEKLLAEIREAQVKAAEEAVVNGTDVRWAKIRAGENAVIENLKKMGLAK